MKHETKLFTPEIIRKAVASAFTKLNPAAEFHNPVMFVTYLGTIYVSASTIAGAIGGRPSLFFLQLSVWLVFTLLFANFAEGLAEAQGRARADSLKNLRSETSAKRRRGDGSVETVKAPELRRGDLVICEAGDMIPGDGEVVEGLASVDESAITGESAPVIRESGGDRSAVTGGTRVISDRIVIRITRDPGDTFIDKMIALIESAVRKKTPGEVALSILLSALTLIFALVVGSLYVFADYSARIAGDPSSRASPEVLVALLVCLIPTTIGGLLSAIGISGIARLLRKNVIATSGRAIEASGDIDVLLLDKTGTITMGNRMASAFIPAPGVSERTLAELAEAASLADETPEGRSIVTFARDKYGLKDIEEGVKGGRFVPFSAATRMSGLDFDDGRLAIRKGSGEAVSAWLALRGGSFPWELQAEVARIASSGGTPLVVARGGEALGVVYLKDIVKGGIKERFASLRRMGIRTVMITGDNPLTAAAIAAEAGVDDYVAEATPEVKLARIRAEQAGGRLVAMIGDGTNDAPSLAQADVGVAMASGTQTAREAGNMVDLDNNPTKLLDIVETGKQLLMTRGSLTTFSIANDVAKYFAIIPAMFSLLYAAKGGQGPLEALNVMRLATPESAILSAVIFNALIIVALIPLALKGVRYRPVGAAALLRRNLFVFGLGGLLSPFLGIKILDLIVRAFGAA
jgi:potassium-transporting ATPase ATP-binding subunit